MFLFFCSSISSINKIPRFEHPNPQFMRDNWMNLNSPWNFPFDFDQSGEEKGWYIDPAGFNQIINVPFCPESKLSGIELTDKLIPAIWYHRKLTLPKD